LYIVNRTESDFKIAEAEEVAKIIDELKEAKS
jgi:hypothetical protein